MEKKRYYNDNVGPCEENEILALNKALELCDELKNVYQIILLIHTKNNTGYLKRVLKNRDLKSFFRGQKIKENYPPLKIETTRTFTDDHWQGEKIVVAFGFSSKELFKYDDFENIVGIIAHQWSDGDVANWYRAWGAIDLKTGLKTKKTSLPDKVVQQAFKGLSNSINMSTGINHSMDNNQCKTYIRALHKYNYELNSKEIFSYLITELNWKSYHAEDVISLIDKMNSGGYFQGGNKTGLQYYIKNWKDEVK